jgi:hypothetical protein
LAVLTFCENHRFRFSQPFQRTFKVFSLNPEATPKEALRRLTPPKPKPKPDKMLEFSLKSSHLWASVHPPIPSLREVTKKGNLIKSRYEMLKPNI